MPEVSSVSEDLSRQLQAAKIDLDLAEAARRLGDNADFRKVILEHFCLRETARYAQVSCDNLLSEAQRRDALGNAQASGYLKRWLFKVLQDGEKASNDISEIEAALDEVRAEEVRL